MQARRILNFSLLRTVGFVPSLLVGLVVVMWFVEPRFFNRINQLDIMRNFAFVSIAAIGQGLVMIIGGFDLSIGAVIALSSITAATVMADMVSAGFGAWVTIAVGVLAALAVAGLVGLINGVLVIALDATPFMITLGTMTALVGIIFYVTNGSPIYGLPDLFTADFARLQVFRIPIMFWIALAIIAVAWIITMRMPVGRHVFAVGGNPSAARAAGISQNRVTVGVYVTSAVLAAIVGLLLTARIGSGQSDLSANAAIQSIAAAVIGGTSLRGGVGNVVKIALGALLLVVLANAINLARIDSKLQTLVLGVVLLVAATIELKTRSEAIHE